MPDSRNAWSTWQAGRKQVLIYVVSVVIMSFGGNLNCVLFEENLNIE